jgi:hypothetical protein
MTKVRLSVNWVFPEMVGPTRSCPIEVTEPSAKLKVGKASRRGMRGKVYRMIEDQPELRNGIGPGDWERVVFIIICESETKFVQ